MSITKKIVENFKTLCELEEIADKPNHFRLRSYRKIIDLFSIDDNMNEFEINDFKNYLQENGMKNPKSALDKIKQIVETGTVDKLKTTQIDFKFLQSIKELTSCYGIGIKKAKELITNGINSIQKLKESVLKDPTVINKKQLIGLEYYDDLLQRIPRKEIQEFEMILTKIIKSLSIQIQFTIAGSYRRKKSDSGDIDLLITSEKPGSLTLLYNELEKQKIIQQTLAKGKKKFMGVIQFNGYPCRHLDIVETSKQDYPFAILYFTGSGPFNVKFRKWALSKGYTLNEYNMTLKKKKQPIDKQIIYEKIGKYQFETEQDIFTFLEYPYVEPENRI